MSEEIVKDLIKILNSERVDLKRSASSTILELTGSKDGLNFILSQKEIILVVIQLINHVDEDIAKNSLKTLVNISCEEDGSNSLVSLHEVNFISNLIQCIQNPNYPHADLCCIILNNVTRFASICSIVLECINNLPLRLEGLISLMCDVKHNKMGQTLDYLALVISNFTQIPEGRSEILNRETKHFIRLLSFIDVPGSKIRRKAVIYAIHNCTFDKASHEWFLSENINLSTRLVMPLAGPDEFTIEENESLPEDLQFLPDDKCREEDKELRFLLLEALMQLCTTRKCREHLREQNIYLILREHHKWETDNRCVILNEDVVNLIIKTEEEIGEEDLSTVEVPTDVAKKFTEHEAETLKEEETK